MTSFRDKYGPWALVTGASAGIGAEFARQIAARGLNLILCARREDRLARLASELSATHGILAHVAAVDLARADFLETLAPALEGREVGLLVSNAGFALTGPFLSHTEEEELSLFDVNCRSPLRLIHRVVRPMAARRRGGLIVVSSATAFAPVPGWTGYSASKAHNLFLGQGLASELRGTGVDVLSVCPASTATEFMDVAGIHDKNAVSAEFVAHAALSRLGRQDLLVPGAQAKLAYALQRLLPRSIVIRLWEKALRDISTKPS